MKFTAEVSDTETTFLNTKVQKGKRFGKKFKLDIKTHFKATETFQYRHFSSCHPPGVKMGFIKGEALRLLRTNSSQAAFKTAIKKNLKQISKKEGTLKLLFQTLSQKLHLRREHALQQKQKANTRILPVVTQYCSPVPNLKQNWHLIQQQPLLRRILKIPPLSRTEGADP